MESKLSKELGWDDTIQNDGDYKIIPDGKYRFVVIKLERSRYKGGDKLPPCNQAYITVVVSDDNGISKTMEEKLKLHTDVEWILCAFFRSIGLRKKGDQLQMKWTEVVGKSGICQVGNRSYTGKKGEPVTINQISEWLPPEEETPATGSFTPGEF